MVGWSGRLAVHGPAAAYFAPFFAKATKGKKATKARWLHGPKRQQPTSPEATKAGWLPQSKALRAAGIRGARGTPDKVAGAGGGGK